MGAGVLTYLARYIRGGPIDEYALGKLARVEEVTFTLSGARGEAGESKRAARARMDLAHRRVHPALSAARAVNLAPRSCGRMGCMRRTKGGCVGRMPKATRARAGGPTIGAGLADGVPGAG